MPLFQGRKGLILGVANEFSIAWAVAKALHAEGAELGFNFLPDKSPKGRGERRVKSLVEPLGASYVQPCDVTDDASIKAFFDGAGEALGSIDFLVHSIAYAPLEDIQVPTLLASREGFKLAMDISVYSLIAVSRAAAKIMAPQGSICAMTYFGGEKVVEGYNVMGVCKAALDAAVRYLAYDLGGQRIRVNAISAGPLKTLAASAVGEFDRMHGLYEAVSPLRTNVTPDDVGRSAAFLLSHMAAATTGEILHVDCGYNIMGSPGRLGQENAQ